MSEHEGQEPPRDGGADGAQGSGEAVGSVAEEAMKLFGALSGWAKEQGDGVGDGFSGMAGGAAKAFHEVNEHIATDGEECKYCPVCRAVHTIRDLSPEVKTHLAVAGSNLMQAAAALMAAVAPEAQDDAARSRDRSDGVEHIPVDEDWPEDPFGTAESADPGGPFGRAPGDAGEPRTP